jgi:hypothetical protein
MEIRPAGYTPDPVPSYEIQVRSEEPIRTSQAMHRAEMPTIDRAGAGFVETSEGVWTVGEEFTVLVAAEDILEALDRLGHVDADFEIVAYPETLQS